MTKKLQLNFRVDDIDTSDAILAIIPAYQGLEVYICQRDEEYKDILVDLEYGDDIGWTTNDVSVWAKLPNEFFNIAKEQHKMLTANLARHIKRPKNDKDTIIGKIFRVKDPNFVGEAMIIDVDNDDSVVVQHWSGKVYRVSKNSLIDEA